MTSHTYFFISGLITAELNSLDPELFKQHGNRASEVLEHHKKNCEQAQDQLDKLYRKWGAFRRRRLGSPRVRINNLYFSCTQTNVNLTSRPMTDKITNLRSLGKTVWGIDQRNSWRRLNFKAGKDASGRKQARDLRRLALVQANQKQIQNLQMEYAANAKAEFQPT